MGRQEKAIRASVSSIDDKRKNEQPAAIAKRHLTDVGNDEADYWQSRAERMKLLAARHDEGTHSLLMKIAAGCEQLAKRIRTASSKNSDRE